MADEDQSAPTELSYEEKVGRASVIAKPMAPKKLAKKLFKLIKKGMKKIITKRRLTAFAISVCIVLSMWSNGWKICVKRHMQSPFIIYWILILAGKQKNHLRSGLKIVQSRIRKGETG